MSARIRFSLACLVILAPAAVRAAGSDEARARQELDQELKALVKIPAPELTLTIEPRGPEGMILDTVTAKVDGKVVHLGGAAAGPGITSVRLWSGKVAPGPHQVSLEVTWDRKASYGRHLEVTLAGGLRLTAQRGLAVNVGTRLAIRPKVDDPQHRYRLSMHATPRMLARVDSTDLPPPPKGPKLVFAAADGGTPDAGAPGAGAPRLAAAAHADGGAGPGAAAAHPRRLLARAAPRRIRHRSRRRPRLHASRAAFAPSRSAPAAPAPPPAAPRPAPSPPAAPAPGSGAPPAAAAPRTPPAPTAPAAARAPSAAPPAHGRVLAGVLAGAGALALLIAGLIFLRR